MSSSSFKSGRLKGQLAERLVEQVEGAVGAHSVERALPLVQRIHYAHLVQHCPATVGLPQPESSDFKAAWALVNCIHTLVTRLLRPVRGTQQHTPAHEALVHALLQVRLMPAVGLMLYRLAPKHKAMESPQISRTAVMTAGPEEMVPCSCCQPSAPAWSAPVPIYGQPGHEENGRARCSSGSSSNSRKNKVGGGSLSTSQAMGCMLSQLQQACVTVHAWLEHAVSNAGPRQGDHGQGGACGGGSGCISGRSGSSTANPPGRGSSGTLLCPNKGTASTSILVCSGATGPAASDVRVNAHTAQREFACQLLGIEACGNLVHGGQLLPLMLLHSMSQLTAFDATSASQKRMIKSYLSASDTFDNIWAWGTTAVSSSGASIGKAFSTAAAAIAMASRSVGYVLPDPGMGSNAVQAAKCVAVTYNMSKMLLMSFSDALRQLPTTSTAGDQHEGASSRHTALHTFYCVSLTHTLEQGQRLERLQEMILTIPERLMSKAGCARPVPSRAAHTRAAHEEAAPAQTLAALGPKWEEMLSLYVASAKRLSQIIQDVLQQKKCAQLEAARSKVADVLRLLEPVYELAYTTEGTTFAASHPHIRCALRACMHTLLQTLLSLKEDACPVCTLPVEDVSSLLDAFLPVALGAMHAPPGSAMWAPQSASALCPSVGMAVLQLCAQLLGMQIKALAPQAEQPEHSEQAIQAVGHACLVVDVLLARIQYLLPELFHCRGLGDEGSNSMACGSTIPAEVIAAMEAATQLAALMPAEMLDSILGVTWQPWLLRLQWGATVLWRGVLMQLDALGPAEGGRARVELDIWRVAVERADINFGSLEASVLTGVDELLPDYVPLAHNAVHLWRNPQMQSRFVGLVGKHIKRMMPKDGSSNPAPATAGSAPKQDGSGSDKDGSSSSSATAPTPNGSACTPLPFSVRLMYQSLVRLQFLTWCRLESQAHTSCALFMCASGVSTLQAGQQVHAAATGSAPSPQLNTLHQAPGSGAAPPHYVQVWMVRAAPGIFASVHQLTALSQQWGWPLLQHLPIENNVQKWSCSAAADILCGVLTCALKLPASVTHECQATPGEALSLCEAGVIEQRAACLAVGLGLTLSHPDAAATAPASSTIATLSAAQLRQGFKVMSWLSSHLSTQAALPQLKALLNSLSSRISTQLDLLLPAAGTLPTAYTPSTATEALAWLQKVSSPDCWLVQRLLQVCAGECEARVVELEQVLGAGGGGTGGKQGEEGQEGARVGWSEGEEGEGSLEVWVPLGSVPTVPPPPLPPALSHLPAEQLAAHITQSPGGLSSVDRATLQRHMDEALARAQDHAVALGLWTPVASS